MIERDIERERNVMMAYKRNLGMKLQSSVLLRYVGVALRRKGILSTTISMTSRGFMI